MESLRLLRNLVTSAILIASLAACGGGGSSSPAPPPPPPPPPPVQTLVVDQPLVETTATILDDFAPTTTIGFRIENRDAGGLFVGARHSGPPILGLTFSQIDNNSAKFTVQLTRPPGSVVGVYTATVDIAVCTDQACAQQIAGSPKTVTVRYTIARPSGPNAPRVVTSATSLDFAALFFRSGQPSPQPKFSFPVAHPPEIIHWRMTSTNNGIDYIVGTQVSNDGTGQVTMGLKPPVTLAIGRHTDVISVRACFDVQCVNEIDGSPFNLTMNYDIVTQVVDAAGNRFRGVLLNAHDMAWDPVSQRIFLTQPSTVNPAGNFVRSLDPETNTLGPAVDVGSQPTALDVSDDGAYLYVGVRGDNAIRRLTLPSLSIDASIPIPGRSQFDAPFYASEIKVAPGQPKLFAIRRQEESSQSILSESVLIGNDTTLLPNIFTPGIDPQQNRWVESLAWGADANTLFGTTLNTSPPQVQYLSVDAGGVAYASSSPSFFTNYFGPSYTHFLNGRLYTDHGQLYDTQTRTMLGALQWDSNLSGVRRAAPDAGLRRIFTFSTYDPSGRDRPYIRVYDIDTFNETAALEIPLDDLILGSGRILRWGNDGLALHFPATTGRGYILLIDGPIVSQ